MATIDSILSNQTITSNGSYTHDCGTDHEIILFWDITGSITGTLPTIQFTIQELDPNIGVDFIGQTVSSSLINSTGTGQIILSSGISSLVLVSWTVGGASPSFGGTNLCVVNREIGNTITSNQGTANTLSNAWPFEITDGTNILGTGAHPIKTDPTGTTTQPVSGTITANAGTGTFTVGQATASNLNATIVGTTAAGSGSSTGLVTIQGNASGTPVPITGSISATNPSVSATAAAVPASATFVGGEVQSLQVGLTTGDLYPLSLTTGGLLRVDGSNVTQPISGTVTANAGTGNFTVVQTTAANLNATVSGTVTANIGTTNGLALDTSVNGILVSQGSTTSGEEGPLVQGAVTTSAPSYTTAQTSPLSLTTAGALRTDSSATTQPISGTITANQGGAPWSDNITQFGGTNISTGTGASGSGIPRITVSNDSNILATQSGTWTVQQGTPPWTVQGDAASGAAVAGNPVLTGGYDGTDARTFLTDSSGRQVVVGAGTAGTSTGGVLTIQGIASGTTVPVSGTITTNPASDSSFATQNITAQDTNSSSTAVANNAVFITGTPTANSTASFSIITEQSVRVQVTGTWTGTLSIESSIDGGTTWFTSGIKQNGISYITNTFTANFIGGLNTSGVTNIRIRSTAAWTGTATVLARETMTVESLYVNNPIALRDPTVQSIQNTIKAASTAASVSDTAIVVAVSPNNTVAVTQSTSPWVGNITQFGSTNISTGTGSSGSGIPRVTVSNDSNVLATQSGTWTVQPGNTPNTTPWLATINQGGNSAVVTASNALKVDGSAVTQPVNGTVTSNQGTANTLANAWSQKITDGTNGPVAVKAASTAPVASDSALVVSLSPNSALTGTSANQVQGTAASGAAPSGNPLQLGVVAPSGNMLPAIGDSAGATGAALMANEFVVSSNATITSSSSQTITKNFYGVHQISLVVNITGSISGTTPTIQYTIQELDPGNGTTTYGNSASTVLISTTGVYIASLAATSSSAVKVTWTVAGASASFGGVYATVISKATINTLITSSTNGFAYGTVTTTSTSSVPLRASTYNEQTTAAQRSISSASASDTSAGTGARTVTITYYDASGNGPFTETDTLNGTTPVNTTATNICFIEKIAVATVGAGGSNAGIITLFISTAGGGGTLATMNAGDNQTFWAHHYVANNRTCYITAMTGHNTSASNNTLFLLRAQNPTSTTSPNLLVSDALQSSASFQPERLFGTPIKVSGPSRITLYGSPSGTPTITSRGSFDFYDQ